MPETITNRCKYRSMLALLNALGANAYMGIISGTNVGVNSATLNTVADLDAVAGVGVWMERLPLTSGTATEDDANGRGALDYGNLLFAPVAGGVAHGVYLFDNSGGTDATKDLLVVYTTNFPQPMDGGLSINIADLLRATAI